MQVVVLAGGIGSRLQPWTFDIPKPILPMLDKTLIEHVIQNVPSNIMTELIVAGGYKINQIKDFYKNDIVIDESKFSITKKIKREIQNK